MDTNTTPELQQKGVAGVDVSRGKVTVCILSELPGDLKRFQSKYKAIELKSDQEGIDKLKELPFDVAILEPSGGHYSKFWATQIQALGREVKWVDHQSIANYRKGWGQLNKTDKADAIALAMYGIERNRFISPKNQELRDLYHQLNHYNGLANPLINRLRQQLAHEWPEVAERAAQREWGHGAVGLWQAIAGIKVSAKWQKEINASVGSGIQEFSKAQAVMLCGLQDQQGKMEQQAQSILESPEYRHYIATLNEYGMSWAIALPVISAIYPMDQFLEDGKELRSHVESRNGKRSRRNHSLAKFKLACGLGLVSHQSGDTERWKPGGRAEIRTALWNWVRLSVVMNPNMENPKIASLNDYFKNGSDQVIDGKIKHFDPGVRNQKMMRVARRGLEMIYRDLIKIAQVQ